MENTPLAALATAEPQSFTPVPVRPRHDGWTPERQAGFIEALAACGCVGDAAARVGMTTDGAYVLRQREGAVSFRAAWDQALEFAVKRLSEAAFSRALHGVARPHYYKGEVVGEHRVYNETLTRFLLQHLDPRRFVTQPPELILYNRDEAKVVAFANAVSEMVADAEMELEASEDAMADEAAAAGTDVSPALPVSEPRHDDRRALTSDVSPALPVSDYDRHDWRTYAVGATPAEPVYELSSPLPSLRERVG